MPPQVLAAIATAAVVLGGAILLARNLRSFIVPLWAAQLRELDVRRLQKGLEGLAAVAEPIAALTPGKLDDEAAALVREYAKEFGGYLVKTYPETAHNMAKTMLKKNAVK